MSTRGLVAYSYKGKTYGIYNHYDSYPTGLGKDIQNALPKLIDFLGKDKIQETILNLEKIKDEEDERKLTQEQLDQYYAWQNFFIQDFSEERKEIVQNCLNDTLTNEQKKDYRINSLQNKYYPLNKNNTYKDVLLKLNDDFTKPLIFGFILNQISFAKDSLFCEWGYVLDFDRDILEVYRGFIKHHHQNGRFGDTVKEEKEYYPIELKFEIPFDKLDTNWAEDIELYEQIAEDNDYGDMEISPHEVTDLLTRMKSFIYNRN